MGAASLMVIRHIEKLSPAFFVILATSSSGINLKPLERSKAVGAMRYLVRVIIVVKEGQGSGAQAIDCYQHQSMDRTKEILVL